MIIYQTLINKSIIFLFIINSPFDYVAHRIFFSLENGSFGICRFHCRHSFCPEVAALTSIFNVT